MNSSKDVSVEVLKQVIETAPIGIYLWKVVDPTDAGSFVLVFGNSEGDRAGQLKWRDFEGKSLSEGFPKYAATPDAKFWAEAIRTGHTQYLPDIEYFDENVPKAIFSVIVVPIDKEYVCEIFRNVTAERTTQKQLKEKLLEIEKLRGIINSK